MIVNARKKELEDDGTGKTKTIRCYLADQQMKRNSMNSTQR
jgi:hypothetical protein